MNVLRMRLLAGLACGGMLAACLSSLVNLPTLAHGGRWYPNAIRVSTCSRPIVKVDRRGMKYLDVYVAYEACLATDDRPQTVIDWYDQRGWKVIVDGIAATGTTRHHLGPLRYTSVKAVVSVRRRNPTTILVRQGFRIEISLGK